MSQTEHRPVLIVIVDDTEARLLFRMTDGRPFKRYTDDIPLWAQTIIG